MFTYPDCPRLYINLNATLMICVAWSVRMPIMAPSTLPWVPMQDFRTLSPTELLLCPLNDLEEKFAPRELFVIGNTRYFTTGPRISIVGSRNASTQGRARAARLAAHLVKAANAVIISGLALGIDTAAHLSAIENGGRTVAVIGTPLDKSYPAANRHLQAQIAEEHLLVSQFPIGTRTFKNSFPMRNRTMALLSDATVIIEAGESSGTESQAWEALRLGRPLLLAKSFAEGNSFKWVQSVISYGAEVLDEDTLEGFIESLPARETSSNVQVALRA